VIDLEDLYFEWLLGRLDPSGVTEGVAYVCGLLHNCEFKRRVGNDLNRAADGTNLRKEFLTEFEDANFDPHVTNDLMAQECSWFEMLVALTRALDYSYDTGIYDQFLELIENMQIDHLAVDEPDRSAGRIREDQHAVDVITSDIDNNRFEFNGLGGLFPLSKPIRLDQRGEEIWEQAGAYFRERLEGVLWTSLVSR
jgi:hypothetical protein